MKPMLRLIIAWIIIPITWAGGPNLDSCDWTGSGTLAMALSRGVQPVYLHCNQGTVRWHYPQGALRIGLQHRPSGSIFQACLKRSKGSFGARIYVAGRKKLFLLFDFSDPVDLVKCVTSENGQVTLYMEANPIADILRKSTAEFRYYLKSMNHRFSPESSDECQPCSEEELLHHYCSSDFVFQGSVSSLYNDEALQRTQLTVRVSKVHRNNSEFNGSSENLIIPTEKIAAKPNNVLLYRPLKCGTKAGSGEYLFLGNWLLGNPSLNCAPRISEWKKVRRKALSNGSNECLLYL